jgi:hypothetical protein
MTSKHFNCHRRITSRAEHAQEILSHAIEYLIDENMHQGSACFAENERIEAVQILMTLNCQVYFECPVVPTFSERCRALLKIN